jgi:hypothetical protein
MLSVACNKHIITSTFVGRKMLRVDMDSLSLTIMNSRKIISDASSARVRYLGAYTVRYLFVISG